MSVLKPDTKLIAVLVIIVLIISLASLVVSLTRPAQVVTVPGVPTTVTVPGPTVTVTVTAPPTPKPPEYTIYYISHGGPGDPWWAPVIKGAELAGGLLGVKVVYMGPEKFSIAWLVDALHAAVAARPDGIIITITDYTALDKPLRDAIAKGIPVLAVNVYDPRPRDERIPYMGYIGQDEYQAGYELARYAVNWFKKKFGRLPKLAVIGIHEPGHIGLELRAKGIQDVFKEVGAPYVPEKLDITPDPAKAYEILSSYILARPETEIIFTLGPLGAHPAIQLVKDRGAVGKLFVATVDLDEIILKGIEDGVVICGVSQQPFSQGFLPVVYMYLYLKYGIKPPEHIPTGPTVIDLGLLGLIRKQIETTGGA